MSDAASHGTSHLDIGEVRHTLTIHDVERELVIAGVPRSHRQVIRYCETGMLDAVKVPGPTGAQWFVSPASLPKAIGDLTQWETQRASRATQEHATARYDMPANKARNENDTAGHGEPYQDEPRRESQSEPTNKDRETKSYIPGSDTDNSSTELAVTMTEPAMSRYVQLLERDNEFLRDQVEKKDGQINDLSKRFGETQTLLGAMQRMLAPLLGQADPFGKTKDREANDPH